MNESDTEQNPDLPLESNESTHESNVTAERKTDEVNKAKPSKIPTAALILSLLSIMINLGILAMGWFSYQNYRNSTAGIVQELDQQTKNTQETLAMTTDIQNQIGQQPWLPNIDELSQNTSARLSAQETVIEALEARFRKLQPSDLEAWQVSQVEFYLLLAQKRLALIEDSIGASLLLEEAIKIGEQIKDPDMLPFLQSMLKNRASLNIQSIDNRDQIVSRLQILLQMVLDLNVPDILSKSRSTNTGTPDQEAATANTTETKTEEAHLDWQSQLSDYVSKTFIRVRKTDNKILPLISPEAQQLTQQQLAILLSQAQLYIMNRDHQSYQQSVRSAKQLAEETFAHPTRNIRFIIQELGALSTVESTENLASLQPSLDAYRNYVSLRKRRLSKLENHTLPSSNQQPMEP